MESTPMSGERIRRRNLPHWDVPGAAYFVTSCLVGSIPAQGLIDIDGYRESLKNRPRKLGMSEADAARERWKLAFARIDRWLDDEPAVRWFDDPALARMMVDTFYFFAGQRYDLLGFVVMPSHIHWVFQPLPTWVERLGDLEHKPSPRERICRSINQHAALEGNRQLGRTGAFWQHEPYDHWIRDADELERILLYIEGNPVKAGLVQAPEDWPFSSAYDRRAKRLELGIPLRR
jgi:type I restriction enzyme R subunit